MKQIESFGECLKRSLAEEGLSASEAARLVGFRSRNSIFRILAGVAGVDVELRFLTALHDVLGDQWPVERWQALEEALVVERLGPDRYHAFCAIEEVLYEREISAPAFHVTKYDFMGQTEELTLREFLENSAVQHKTEIVITGCFNSELCSVISECCAKAGAEGRLKIRHYIDTEESVVTQNILSLLPLIGKSWYNARLVQPGDCPPQMQAIYRLNALYVQHWAEDGTPYCVDCTQDDERHFACQYFQPGVSMAQPVLDRWRFDLELLKPMPRISVGPESYVEYTDRCAQLEKDCGIYSIKPDLHFQCIPSRMLEQAVLEGFEQAGFATESELMQLIEDLKVVHDRRFANMQKKHKPTHFVYSLKAMEHFMRTGVQCDHFFMQRPYTPEERRVIIRGLRDMMNDNPWFNIHFMKTRNKKMFNEITLYDGRGILLMDANTGYDLNKDHSEAVVALPAFMDSFKRYFVDELLVHHVLSRNETIRELERLLVMNVQ